MTLRATVALALFLVPLAAAQTTLPVPEPNELPDCGLSEPILFAKADASFENLAFDGVGSLWLTAFEQGLWRASPNGTVEFVARDEEAPAATGLDDPGAFMGIDVGPDGALYVAEGLSIAQPVPARVLRFPTPGAPEFEVYAEGMDGVNGLAVTPDGVVYVAHGFRDELWRIPAKGEVEAWTQVVTVNGVVEHPDGERLVVAQVAAEGTPATAIRFDDPASREVLVRFNPTGGPVHLKGVDDLVVAPDGVVYGSAHLRDQVLRGDPASGEVCVAMDFTRLAESGVGENLPTSVRIARGFGEWDGKLFSIDAAGEIWVQDIGLAGAEVPTPGGTEDPRATAVPGAFPLISVALAALWGRR